MKKLWSAALFVLLSAAVITACSEEDSPVNTDPVVQSDMDITGFSKIDMKDGFTAVVNIQGQTDVKVNFNESIRDYVKVQGSDSTLKLEIEGELTRVEGKTYNATIGMPTLVDVKMSDGSKLTVNSQFVTGPWFKGDLKDGSMLNGSIVTSDFELKGDNGSTATLTGSATTGDLKLDHGAAFDLRNFVLLNSDIDAKNGSTVYINISGVLNVKADGGSKIYYRGNPALGTIDLKGGSTLEAF